MSFSTRALIVIHLDKHAGNWVPLGRVVHLMRSDRETISQEANDLAGLGLIARKVIDGTVCYGVQTTEHSQVIA